MKRITALLLALTVTGCASTYHAAPQAYRAKGQDNQIIITGKADSSLTENKVHLYFDGLEQISGELDRHYNAELTGKPYNGKNTSATCTGTRKTSAWVEVRCIVFIENERAATLTF